MGLLWRLTRNRYGRRLYDALHEAGITATWMLEYVAALDDAPDGSMASDHGDDGTGDESVAVAVCESARVERLGAPTDQLRDDEEVLGAFADGAALGYLFLSVDATHDIRPLQRRLAFDGAYVRRVFVDPGSRNRGIGSALVAGARRRARERGAAETTALVAFDNSPSRRLFEKQGFRPRRDRLYARLGPFTRRRVRERA